MSNLKKILVIDDEPTMIKLTRDIFGLFDIEADFVESAEDGLAILRDNSYSMIILDMKLPKMSGFEFYSKIKNKDIPVLISSGFSEKDVMERFEPSANISFLQKPFSVHELIREISKYIKLSHKNNSELV